MPWLDGARLARPGPPRNLGPRFAGRVQAVAEIIARYSRGDGILSADQKLSRAISVGCVLPRVAMAMRITWAGAIAASLSRRTPRAGG